MLEYGVVTISTALIQIIYMKEYGIVTIPSAINTNNSKWDYI